MACRIAALLWSLRPLNELPEFVDPDAGLIYRQMLPTQQEKEETRGDCAWQPDRPG